MYTLDVKDALEARPHIKSIIIFGIETHICVLQTTLSLLSLSQYTTHVIADGVSSCNAFEIPIALERMRREGAIVGTSESVAFQLMGDASLPTFKTFSRFVKDEKEATKRAGEVLLQGKEGGEGSGDGEVASGGVVLGLKSAM